MSMIKSQYKLIPKIQGSMIFLLYWTDLRLPIPNVEVLFRDETGKDGMQKYRWSPIEYTCRGTNYYYIRE